MSHRDFRAALAVDALLSVIVILILSGYWAWF